MSLEQQQLTMNKFLKLDSQPDRSVVVKRGYTPLIKNLESYSPFPEKRNLGKINFFFKPYNKGFLFEKTMRFEDKQSTNPLIESPKQWNKLFNVIQANKKEEVKQLFLGDAVNGDKKQVGKKGTKKNKVVGKLGLSFHRQITMAKTNRPKFDNLAGSTIMCHHLDQIDEHQIGQNSPKRFQTAGQLNPQLLSGSKVDLDSNSDDKSQSQISFNDTIIDTKQKEVQKSCLRSHRINHKQALITKRFSVQPNESTLCPKYPSPNEPDPFQFKFKAKPNPFPPPALPQEVTFDQVKQRLQKSIRIRSRPRQATPSTTNRSSLSNQPYFSIQSARVSPKRKILDQTYNELSYYIKLAEATDLLHKLTQYQ